MEAVNRIIRTSTYMYDRGKKTNIFKYTFCCRFTRVNNVFQALMGVCVYETHLKQHHFYCAIP